MGNKIFLTIFLFITIHFSHIVAQPYVPLIDTNKNWNVVITGTSYPNGGYSDTLSFFVSGDTLIGNLIYNKLFYITPDSNGSDTIIYSAAIREDTILRKVYAIHANTIDTTEKLLYDFSLNIGDTLSFYNNVYGYESGTIDSIGYIMIDSICLKRYRIVGNFGQCGNSWDYLVESIGSTQGILYPAVCFVDFGPYFSLINVIKNGDTIYKYNDKIPCQSNNTKEYPISKAHIIELYPNPFSSQTVLQTDNLLNNATFTIYNYFGQTVKQINNISGQTITLHRDNLPSGLYFVRLTQDNKIITANKIIIVD